MKLAALLARDVVTEYEAGFDAFPCSPLKSEGDWGDAEGRSPKWNEMVAEKVQTSAPNAAIRSYTLKLTPVGRRMLAGW